MEKAFFKLVAVLLVGSFICSSYGSVLCYGHDGQIRIEPVLHDHCEHSEESAEHGSAFSETCKPCVDVIVGNHIQPVRFKKTVLHDGVIFTGYTVGMIVQSQSASADGYESFSFFAPLNSIRLLI